LDQLLKAIILGLIQGLTEWFPISSTGHLRLVERLLGLGPPILFDVTLHMGTLAVIFLFFRKDVIDILRALGRLDFKTENGKLIPLIITGTIPTALIGLIFGSTIETAFKNVLPIAIAFMFCGIALYASKIGKERKDKIAYLEALIIGTVQGVAIIPGISRSGMTVAIAVILGIKRKKAFKFSFLLSVPAIFGALGLTLYTQYGELFAAGLGWTDVVAGVVIAAILGYLCLKILWKILVIKKFYVFAFYCWVLGAVLIALNLSGF